MEGRIGLWRRSRVCDADQSEDGRASRLVRPCSGVVAAELLRGVGEAAAVVDEEATGAGEFVRLLGDDADGEFWVFGPVRLEGPVPRHALGGRMCCGLNRFGRWVVVSAVRLRGACLPLSFSGR